MNCSAHPDVAAVAFCRTCGKGLCTECRREAAGTLFCEEHAPAPGGPAFAQTYSQTADRETAAPVLTNPKLAFLLGLIPGVGAIYNAQYAKGLVHALVFGLLISILDSNAAHGLEPLVALLLAAFVMYMAFEAYHTAHRRQQGESVDEFSSVFHPRYRRSSGGAAIALIVVGAVFLLNTLEIVDLHQIMRFWPVLLIAVGVNMLYTRMSDERGGRP